ncbi:MAG TPA: hypothetical protein VLL73_03325, partial [Desulfurivibrionaceae bacterium]|nr:hypothetical protein [Desulfurivibrionaceae bacterium]
DDQPFAELLCGKLQGWGLNATAGAEPPQEAVQAAAAGETDVILLDIRQQATATLNHLAAALKGKNGVEVVLINTAEGINASMEGMRAGASDEITTPLDAATLKKKIMAAIRRRQKAKKAASGKKRSLWGMLEQTMNAATFAQAGEFDTAMEFLKEKDSQTKPPAE